MTQLAKDERRLMVTWDFIAQMLATGNKANAVQVVRGLPVGCELRRVEYDERSGIVSFVVSHEVFEHEPGEWIDVMLRETCA